MTLQEIQNKAQGIIHKWRDDDSAPYIEFVEELAHMTVPEPFADLEEAAAEYASDSTGFIDMTAYRAIIVGAKWQKEQMMKEAVDVDTSMAEYNDADFKSYLWNILMMKGAINGQKVKLIILED